MKDVGSRAFFSSLKLFLSDSYKVKNQWADSKIIYSIMESIMIDNFI